MIVLDASAIMALLNDEPGAEAVSSAIPDSVMSIVNVSEVLTKSVERGGTSAAALAHIHEFGVEIAAFDEEQALKAADLRRHTVSRGLSIGDRACLALAIVKNCEVLTADRAWIGLPHGVKVTLIR